MGANTMTGGAVGIPWVNSWCTTAGLAGGGTGGVITWGGGRVWLMAAIRLLQLPEMVLPGELLYAPPPVSCYPHPKPGFPNIWHNL